MKSNGEYLNFDGFDRLCLDGFSDLLPKMPFSSMLFVASLVVATVPIVNACNLTVALLPRDRGYHTFSSIRCSWATRSTQKRKTRLLTHFDNLVYPNQFGRASCIYDAALD